MNFSKMSIIPDSIKIYAPNFTGRCITAAKGDKTYLQPVFLHR